MSSPNSDNARVLITNMVRDEHQQRAPELNIEKFFEFFVATQILKDHNLSDEEILSGIPTDNKQRDGGIDGLYLFFNHRLIPSGAEPENEQRISEIQLVVIQCKYTERLAEEIVHKLVASMKDLLDLNNDLESETMLDRYNSEFIDTMLTFRQLYKASRSGVKISFDFYVAHLAKEVPPHLFGKTNHLQDMVTNHISEATLGLKFLGPRQLVDLVRREPKSEFALEYRREVISPDERGFTCLINLYAFYTFIHDSEIDNIRESMFEANVRDYQGENSVNADITQTLAERDSQIDFWWLNNGVTMVAEKVTRRRDSLIIENPEIVNGLQTSYTIHSYFSAHPQHNTDQRHILVRIVQLDETDDQTRDRIIRATNSQTPIPPLLLHATETIHHNIEYHLKKCSPPLYYERRKSYYRNRGKKINEIMDLQSLAQAIVAILLWHPDDARTRIRAFIKVKENYDLVFNPDYNYDFFHVCAMLRKNVETYINSSTFSEDRQRRSKAKYILHHVMTDLAIVLIENTQGVKMRDDIKDGSKMYASQLAKLNINRLTNEVLQSSVERVMSIFENEKYMGLPNAVKGADMVNDVIVMAQRVVREK